MSLPLSLLLAPQAYRLDPERPLGRESAGAGFQRHTSDLGATDAITWL